MIDAFSDKGNHCVLISFLNSSVSVLLDSPIERGNRKVSTYHKNLDKSKVNSWITHLSTSLTEMSKYTIIPICLAIQMILSVSMISENRWEASKIISIVFDNIVFLGAISWTCTSFNLVMAEINNICFLFLLTKIIIQSRELHEHPPRTKVDRFTDCEMFMTFSNQMEKN